MVKAYTEATKNAIDNSNIVEKEEGYVVEAIINYDDIRNFEYICIKNSIQIIKKEYLEKVKILIELSKEKYKKNVEGNTKGIFQNIPTKIIEEKIINKS